ncbi:MAG: hypothetical protein R6U94_04865 [Nitriliruptoraceae bacterium]
MAEQLATFCEAEHAQLTGLLTLVTGTSGRSTLRKRWNVPARSGLGSAPCTTVVHGYAGSRSTSPHPATAGDAPSGVPTDGTASRQYAATRPPSPWRSEGASDITFVAVDDAARYARTHSIADPVLLDLEGRYLRDLNDTLNDDLAGAGQTNEPALLSAIGHASE